ncbi:hypothetical protein [Rubrivirga marina]|uniref:Uncharacterized protein n=1 Tax=Rubrivirga marina TaxID=1196024 RepID=A0A271IWU4_9BACT|nr:hypothetical protein [Rubrivirga marina]PAP75683.1 hypothetical protein BSZ37_04150 [Rubrivirga marina]
MTRLQTALLLVLLALASLVVGRAAWDLVADPLWAALTVLPALAASAARSVPEWVGWVAFSSIWWLPCALGKRRWACGSRACISRPSAA